MLVHWEGNKQLVDPESCRIFYVLSLPHHPYTATLQHEQIFPAPMKAVTEFLGVPGAHPRPNCRALAVPWSAGLLKHCNPNSA